MTYLERTRNGPGLDLDYIFLKINGITNILYMFLYNVGHIFYFRDLVHCLTMNRVHIHKNFLYPTLSNLHIIISIKSQRVFVKNRWFCGQNHDTIYIKITLDICFFSHRVLSFHFSPYQILQNFRQNDQDWCLWRREVPIISNIIITLLSKCIIRVFYCNVIINCQKE